MDTITFILIGSICIVIGFLIGQVFSSLVGGKKPDTSKTQRIPVLKLWLDPAKDNFVLEMDENEYENSVELSVEQSDYLHKVILRLNDWLTLTPSGIPETVEIDQDVEDIADQELTQEPAQPKPSFNPVTMLVNYLKADVPTVKLPTKSIVSQIDEVLQEKLKDSPLAGQPVRLMEFQEKGMVVMVGLDQYDTVEDVPDPEIQEIIRSAVQEWEQDADEDAG